jgi:hypothetical protein
MFTHVNVLTTQVIGAAIEVHRYLGPGLLGVGVSAMSRKGASTQRHSLSIRMAVALGLQGDTNEVRVSRRSPGCRYRSC